MWFVAVELCDVLYHNCSGVVIFINTTAFSYFILSSAVVFSVESCGMLTLKNAVKAFQELRILDSYRGGSLTMLSLTEHFGVQERLHKYIEILKVARS
jgi:hypothetical protein